MGRDKRTERDDGQPKITPAHGSEWLRSPSSDPLREEASERAKTVVENEEEEEQEEEPSGPEV